MFARRAQGPVLIGADGRRYLDFIMGWGPLILGHNPPAVMRALRAAAGRGVLFGLTHVAEVELAALICDAVPSVERVRFTVSGTEACMTAIRLARAHTGRAKVLIFKGCYHGHGDALMAGSTAGIPPGVAADTVSVPFNDSAALDKALAEHRGAVACAILEPVAANMGVVPPDPGYLAHVRSSVSAAGALLIFDEVVTGFRVAYGGAQERYGIRPDLTVFGKIIGGGLPIGALGGPVHLMSRLAPEGNVYHGGTFAGHPLSMACGIAALRALKPRAVYQRLEETGHRLEQGLREAAARAGIPVVVNRVGSMLTVFFSARPVRRLADAHAADARRFARWANRLRELGVLVPPSPLEAMFVSTAHRAADIDRTVAAAADAYAETARHGTT